MADLLDEVLKSIPKRTAVAKLVGYCEGLCATGSLGEDAELRLRILIAETLSAFDMPAKADRQPHAITKATAHLGAALIQTTASDDQIIMDHVRAAHSLLGGVL